MGRVAYQLPIGVLLSAPPANTGTKTLVRNMPRPISYSDQANDVSEDDVAFRLLSA